MIEVEGLTKRYGSTLAVDNLSFSVKPGIVTGFLGPNGAGKSTTMRIILGLDNPTGGTARIDGQKYNELPSPLQKVGSLLDAREVQGGRSAYNHLLWRAQAAGIPTSRVKEVLEVVGLSDAAKRRVGGFSLGMFQRLGIAGALLGDPEILMFDEPVNGLDPEGIIWIRRLMRRLASEGRTIFVSSHLMSEMQETADHVIVIGRGKLIADTSVHDFTAASTGTHVRVVSPKATALRGVLEQAGATVTEADGMTLQVTNLEAPRIGELALANAIALHELSPQRASLEAAFLELTRDSVEYQTEDATPATSAAGGQS